MIFLLGSGIGRGHAFYLDGVEEAVRAAGAADRLAPRVDVFDVSSGMSLAAWRAARAAYRLGGSGGIAGAAYSALRGESDYNRGGPLLRTFGRDIARWWAGRRGLLLVDHPAVVGALAARDVRDDVAYMHGEMVAPREAHVRGASRILVPLAETADAFVRGGIPPQRLSVTGICVESGVRAVAEPARAARQARLSGTEPLTVAFFSSGAEPRVHVATIAAGAVAVARSGRHRALVFAARGGRLADVVRHVAARERAMPALAEFGDRRELDRVTAEAFPGIDVVVSPPHERSNWAVALGVPFLLVGPDLGPFAPMNRALLKARKVAVDMDSRLRALALPARLDHMRKDGELLAMSGHGTGPAYDGFESAARTLLAADARP